MFDSLIISFTTSLIFNHLDTYFFKKLLVI